MTTSTTTTKEIERGDPEVYRHFDAQRAKWPKAFPAEIDEIRPLQNGIEKAVAEAFGWSVRYTRAVLRAWRMRESYCMAVLAHSERITLDGAPSGQKVTEEARAVAQNRLAQIQQQQVKTTVS
jgi:sRNA-binding protein